MPWIPVGGGGGIDVEDDGTPIAAATTLDFTTGLTATDQGGGLVEIAATGGSGGGWVDRVSPPASPGAEDDYFDGGSLDGKWTPVNISGTDVLTVAPGTMLLSVSATDTTAGDINGILQTHTLAVGDMIGVGVRFAGNAANGMGAGVLLADGTTGAANAVWFGFDNFSNGRILDRSGTLTAMNTSAAQLNTIPLGYEPWFWFGIEHQASNTFRKWLSVDGVTWSQFGLADFTPTLTPTEIGVGWSTWGTGILLVSFAGFRRFTA